MMLWILGVILISASLFLPSSNIVSHNYTMVQDIGDLLELSRLLTHFLSLSSGGRVPVSLPGRA